MYDDAPRRDVLKKYNQIFNEQTVRAKPYSNEDYFKQIKQRTPGVPIKADMPRRIEGHTYIEPQRDLPENDPGNQTMNSMADYKEIIPSFLPDDQKYLKFINGLNHDEDDQRKKI